MSQETKYRQTRVNDYFPGGKNIPDLDASVKGKENKKINKPLIQNKNKPTVMRKRKLAVPLFDDDEDDELEIVNISLNKSVTPNKLNKSGISSDADATIILTPFTLLTKVPRLSFERDSSFGNTSSSSNDFTLEIIDDVANNDKAEKSINFALVKKMKEFIIFVKKSPTLSELLSADELDILTKFLKLSNNYKYFLLKLFMWQVKFYNFYKFSKDINLTLNESDSLLMYSHLKKYNYVDVNNTLQDERSLLEELTVKDVKDICQQFKMKNIGKTKEDMIKKLLYNRTTQSTLTTKKTTNVILKERIAKKMGLCVKISSLLYDTLSKIYVLNTFASKIYVRHQDFFYQSYRLNLPKYTPTEFKVFDSIDDFNSYFKAVQLDVEYERIMIEAGKNKKKVEIDADLYNICCTAFERLESLTTANLNIARKPLDYHQRFTAVAKYISILSKGATRLSSSHFEEVILWLTSLLELPFCQSRRCAWFLLLSKIYKVDVKDYQKSAELLIEVLSNEKDSLSDYQKYELQKRARTLKARTCKLSRLYLNRLDELLLDLPILDRHWPSITVSSQTVRENETGKKRLYVIETEGNRNFVTVENVALEHYFSNGYTSGKHSEGKEMCILFCLLFWDIIFDDSVEGVYVSNFQDVPLDLYTKQFYLNRKTAIENRTENIASVWTDDELHKFLSDNFSLYSNLQSPCGEIDKFSNFTQLNDLVSVVGRYTISKIVHRLACDYQAYHSGLPDLLVWNTKTIKAKFVEVKGEHDKPSIKQKLWFNYLMDVGADFEVCHIHSIGSKQRLDAK